MARMDDRSRTFVWLIAAGVAVCGSLVWAGLTWPQLAPEAGGPADLLSAMTAAPHPFRPFVELLKLVAAAMIGLMITAAHQRYPGEKAISRTMAQSQVLLCVSGALMMIVIGNSVARALGIAGGASIIRFRTPVDDPKDTTILFIVLGLGMACGLGAFAVAGLGTAFVIVFLAVLDHVGDRKPRAMMVEVVAKGAAFPLGHVQDAFRRHDVVFEPREVSQDDEASIRYHVVLGPTTSLYHLNEQLMGGGAAGLKSVSWEPLKKSG